MSKHHLLLLLHLLGRMLVLENEPLDQRELPARVFEVRVCARADATESIMRLRSEGARREGMGMES